VTYEVTLLVFGILLLLLGLVGKIKAKEIEVGTSSAMVRVVTTLVGLVLMVLSFNPDIPKKFLTNLTEQGAEPMENESMRLEEERHRKPEQARLEKVRRREEALKQYDAIQALYGEHKSKKSCIKYRSIVEQIKVYVGSTNPVPKSFRYSIRYPSKKPMPTISDLAIDRITRIQRVRSQCFK